MIPQSQGALFSHAGCTVFPVHAPEERETARQLADFLESGCAAQCFLDDALIRPDADLIALAEEGLTADVLILLLSPASSPAKWPIQRWEPALIEQPRRARVPVAVVLLAACAFPQRLRRGAFFDATAGLLPAFRQLRRWLWNTRRPEAAPAPLIFSANLDAVYAAVGDRPGCLTLDSPDALRFFAEAAADFEAACWIPAAGRSLAQVAGALARELGIFPEDPLEDVVAQLRIILAKRRLLLVLDAPEPGILPHFEVAGRTSLLITASPASPAPTLPPTLVRARALTQTRDLAEAEEMFRSLLQAGIETEACARELIRIYDYWERPNEAGALRHYLRPEPSVQISLFN